MNITDLKSGDDIVITLLETKPEIPVRVKNTIIKRPRNKSNGPPGFLTGVEGMVLANANK